MSAYKTNINELYSEFYHYNQSVAIAFDIEYIMHIPADTRSAFPVISVQSPVSIQCCWQS